MRHHPSAGVGAQALAQWQTRLPLNIELIAQNRAKAIAITHTHLIERLAAVWKYYDETIFDSWISEQCIHRLIGVSFSTRGRSKNVGARLITRQQKRKLVSMQIRFSLPYLAQRSGPASIFGVECKSNEEVAITLLEHEMVHQVEILIYGNSDCRKQLFHFLASGFFGIR